MEESWKAHYHTITQTMAPGGFMIFVLMEIKCDIENKRSRSYNLYIALYFKGRINSDIYTPYDEMPIHINGKFTMGKLKSSSLSKRFVLKRPSVSIGRSRWSSIVS